MTAVRDRYLNAAAAAIIVMAAAVSPAASQTVRTESECTWATQWINNGLSLFMARGYVEKIAAKDDCPTVFVGAPWHRLSFAQQGEFLRNFTRSREITGHDPSCTVIDTASGTTVARVTPNGIELLTPEGDFRPYAAAAVHGQGPVD